MKRLIILLALFLLLAAEALAEPQRLASMETVPETGENGFLNAGEDAVYFKDHTSGYWFYLSDTVRIEIQRVQTSKLTYYTADIVCAPGTGVFTVPWNTKKPGRTNGLPQDMAKRENVVYAQSGDFYSYRVAKKRYPGVIIRDGKTLYKKTYSKTVQAIPNLATIAFYPSGKAEVNESWEMSAKNYLSKGAETVMAFGPILIRNEELQDVSGDAYDHKEPRSCFGIVEPNHYIGLLVEGRKKHSEGCNLETCAQILQDIGCTDAINLDGGNTAAMLFMGESVQLDEHGGVDVNTRSIPDILCVGTY